MILVGFIKIMSIICWEGKVVLGVRGVGMENGFVENILYVFMEFLNDKI